MDATSIHKRNERGFIMEEGKLKRKLSLIDMTFLALGGIIGSGWLFASLVGANTAGPSAWIAWIIGAVAVMFLGLVYAELGGALPRSGGIIRYPSYSHGPMVGYLTGFAALIASSTVPPIEAEAVRQYVSGFVPAIGGGAHPNAAGWVLELGLLVAFFFLNYWSVNVFGKVNTIVTTIKFIVPILTVVILFTHFQIGNFSSHGFAPFGFTGIESAVSTAGIIFAFQGFRQSLDFAGEAINPQRNVPLSIILSISLAAILYICLQLVFVGALPGSALSHGWAAVSFKAPFANLAGALGIGWLASLMYADSMVSPSGTCNIYFGSTSRLTMAWSKTGTFFNLFGKVDKRTGIPRGALWLVLVLTLFWAIVFPSWGQMVGVVSSATVVTYIMGPIAARTLRTNAPGLKRPFRLNGMGILAPIAFVVASLIVYWTGWNIDCWVLAIQVVAWLVYIGVKAKMPSHVPFAQQLKSSYWLIGYYVMMFVMSYLGTFGKGIWGGGAGIIHGPWDQILVIIFSIGAFYWGVKAGLPKADLDEDAFTDVAAKTA